MAASRTKKSVFNFLTAMGAQMLSIVMNFICRTVFIATLGRTYLGIGGLFSNILNMLSLAEMGIGTAITFYMYEPLAHGDKKRIVVLINFYKRVYRVIALLVTVIGVCLIPFFPTIIKDYDKFAVLGLNAAFIFLLYLSQAVSTYLFFAYRTVVIKADQKEYVLNVVSYLTIIGQNILQMISLLVFKNFTIYILINVAFVIIQNIVNAVIVRKRYPFIADKVDERLTREEVIGIFKDTRAAFIYKLNRVILKSTDNIVLSAFIGLDAVALFSNYYIFYKTINSFYNKINNSLIHSLGNLHTEHEKDHEYLVFRAMVFVMAIVGGITFVGIGVVADELITVWIGADWVISRSFSILMGIELFVLSVQYFLSKYRNAIGLFQQMQIVPLYGAITNVVLSIILVHFFDISGVVLGTIITETFFFMVFDPYIIYRFGFDGKYKVRDLYILLFKLAASATVAFFLARAACGYVLVGFGWFSVVVHAIMCGAMTPLMMVAMNARSEEARYLFGIVKNKLKHR